MKIYTMCYCDTITADSEAEAYKTFQEVISKMDDEGIEYCTNITKIEQIPKRK